MWNKLVLLHYQKGFVNLLTNKSIFFQDLTFYGINSKEISIYSVFSAFFS